MRKKPSRVSSDVCLWPYRCWRSRGPQGPSQNDIHIARRIYIIGPPLSIQATCAASSGDIKQSILCMPGISCWAIQKHALEISTTNPVLFVIIGPCKRIIGRSDSDIIGIAHGCLDLGHSHAPHVQSSCASGHGVRVLFELSQVQRVDAVEVLCMKSVVLSH
jgi:hypothetical protein